MKNFGLNLKIQENSARIDREFSFDGARYANKAKQDFEHYANNPEEPVLKEIKKPEYKLKRWLENRPKTVKGLVRCNTFLCNWEGETEKLYRNNCPCCGSKVKRVKK